MEVIEILIGNVSITLKLVSVSKFVINFKGSVLLNVAFKLTFLFTVIIIGFAVVVVSVDHPVNSQPESGTAVNFTLVPEGYEPTFA